MRAAGAGGLSLDGGREPAGGGAHRLLRIRHRGRRPQGADTVPKPRMPKNTFLNIHNWTIRWTCALKSALVFLHPPLTSVQALNRVKSSPVEQAN